MSHVRVLGKVLLELPMEFAVEAQKLVAISLEGSAHGAPMLRRGEHCNKIVFVSYKG